MSFHLGFGLLTGLLLAAAPQSGKAAIPQPETPAPAAICDVKQVPQPSRRMRLYRDRYLGFTFQIPTNYRAAAIRNGTMIMNPASYREYQCFTQNKITTELPWVSINVKVTPIQMRSAVLYDHAIQAMPGLKTEGEEFTEINFVDRIALTYRQKNLVQGGMTRYVSFLSNDRTKLVTIYGPEGEPEFDRSLKTLRMK